MSKKKRPTSAEMVELLNQPHFASAAPAVSPASDPIMPTPMLLDVEKIKTYDHNPRRVPNSEYQAIYDSIQANGLDQVLTVTRRPNDEQYMVFAGGNTRLEIVQRLYRETQDAKYQQINVLFRPWSGDTETLLAHLRENDQRGDLTFIDRAYALVELRQMLEQELGLEGEKDPENAQNLKQESCQGGVSQWDSGVGTETAKGALLSNNRFAEILRERGYTIRRQGIHLYWYAVEELADWIPSILRGGAGRPQIEEIYRTDKVFMDTWHFLKLQPVEEARMIFHTLIQRFDDEGKVDTELLWSQLKKELSVASDQTLNVCGMLMLRISESGTTGLEDWFWEADAQDKAREAQEEAVQVVQQQVAATTKAEPEDGLASSFTADPDLDANEFNLEPWDPEEEAEDLEELEETYIEPPPAPPKLDNRDFADFMDGFKGVDTEPELGLEDEKDPENAQNYEQVPCGTAATNSSSQISDKELEQESCQGGVPQWGNYVGTESANSAASASPRQGHSNYSYALAEAMNLPLSPMPTTVVELRAMLLQLAQQLLTDANLNDALACPIPTGLGFMMLPITSKSAENLNARDPNDKRWLHALGIWSELADFSQQFMFGSPAHRYIPEGFREAYPFFVQAMENAETDELLFADYEHDDWAALSNGVPYLSGWHGRESRTYRVFADVRLMPRKTLATYMQLIDAYRALHELVDGDIWRDAA